MENDCPLVAGPQSRTVQGVVAFVPWSFVLQQKKKVVGEPLVEISLPFSVAVPAPTVALETATVGGP
ncbi:MAG: hypothetical protein FJ225_07265 [Lentisphaerae bacterium]|nr:hypothetical protein [Lentisphaerota bacterium]